MRIRTCRYVAAAAGALLLGLGYLHNASWPARPAAARVTLLAHRGVHQTFACPEIARDTCTAACIAVPTHGFLENTIPSMRAAFDFGADIVELDVHPTTDGHFAVFHDWELACRTNGAGVTRERPMAYLRTLDVGQGYTADGGVTFPFRGRGAGLMPTLAEVLDAFPGRRFLVNIKSDDPAEADRLADFLQTRPLEQRRLLSVYGGERPVTRLLSLVPELRGFTRAGLESCALRYAALGWTGWIPSACRDTLLVLPVTYAPWFWGWPHRFLARMHGAGTEVFAVGGRTDRLAGIDTPADLARITGEPFTGGIWTDRIEVIGPLVRAR